jgi:hypothetical protein
VGEVSSQRLGVRLYQLAVISFGLVLVGTGVARLPWRENWVTVVSLIALILLSNSRFGAVPLSHDETTADVSAMGPLALASILLLPAVGVPLVTANTGWRGATLLSKLFNIGMSAVMGAASAATYHALHGVVLTEPGASFTVTSTLLPFLAASLVWEGVNGLLVVGFLSLSERVSPLRIWYGMLAPSAAPIFIYSFFGLMMAVIWSYVGPVAAILVLAPLVVSRWVFAEFSMRQQAYERTMQSLIKAVETKDYYTRGHSERVSLASVMIGRRSGMREDRVTTLRYAGMLHDVGKLGVPTEVLQASGKLTDVQYEAIQLHPVRGREITKDLEFLGEAIEAIHLHHERIDGRGYPLGLKGAEIPEFARIIAVADAFDSMTTTRSYRGARSVEDAIDELRRCKGSQFDPVMVEALVEAVLADGWELVDTSSPPAGASTSHAIDDDDPTVAGRLGIVIPMTVPRDASELDDDRDGRP